MTREGIILIVFLSATSKAYQQVASCPENIKQWNSREFLLQCQEDTPYHCILMYNSSTLFEVCISKKVINSGEDGCPWILFHNGEAIMGDKRTKCPPENTGCPSADHRGFTTNQIYHFPACFISEEERFGGITSKLSTQQTTPGEVQGREEKNEINSILIVLLVVFGCSTFGCIIIAVYFFWRRRSSGPKKETFSHEESAVELLDGKRTNQETFSHEESAVELLDGKQTNQEQEMRSEKREMECETLRGEVWEETDGSTEDQSTVSVTEISSFTHGNEFIKTINLLSDAEAWIHSHKSTENDRVNNEGKKISERMIGTDFEDFTVIDDDHVYTHFANKMIRRVSSSGVILDLASTAPLCPVGIFTARAGGLLVCLYSDVSKINKDSYGEVHHIGMNGKLLRKYPDHGDGQTKLFTHPSRLVQNINLDLCVVDVIATDFTSRLVVLAVDGKLRFHYKGQKSLKERFSSDDICCDREGRIILSDYYNHAVHLMSADGQFIKFLLTDRSTLRYPRSLAMRGDKLWVGCTGGFIKVYKIKL